MEVAVVVPAHNAVGYLERCLKAIVSSMRKPDQLIVVDDGSTDSAVMQTVKKFDARYVRVSNGPCGPAFARNLGVGQTNADILLFIDSDVVVDIDTIGRVEQEFIQNNAIDALFGSYDDDPAVKTIVSRYKNLLHHYVHQNGKSEASTFWAGCGAVRRRAYLAVGGFSESFARPSIEDIDLGMRLVSAGYRIKLCPDIQVKHLKHWTLTGMIKTDIFSRAAPWTRLLSERSEGVANDLNTKMIHRVSALIMLLLLFFVFLMLAGYKTAHLVAILALIYLIIDYRLWVFFFRKGGMALAVGSALLHGLYYVYSSAMYVVVRIKVILGR